MRLALDSNILIYSHDEPNSEKGKLATKIIISAAEDCVIPAQALGEFLRFMQRKDASQLSNTVSLIIAYRGVFLAPHATDATWDIAARWSVDHNIQFWDALICAVALNAGASVLLSEDMQDGRVLDGLKIVNPFSAANAEFVAALIGNEGRR